MVVSPQVKSLAKEAYLFLSGEDSPVFEDLYTNAQSFYHNVAEWHIANAHVFESLEEATCRLFDEVMLLEQKRRKETRIHSGFDGMNDAVKENYSVLAQWHMGLVMRER